ncbi:MAG: CapA family protein [Deltaproteobacteria bacterium]|nr:CapA family protein [Deltaproteobacteria bacterium]
MRAKAAALGRWIALALLAGALHELLFWLWNPRVDVGLPRMAAVESSRHGPIVIAVGGDTALTDAALPMLRRKGYAYALAPTLHLFRDADLAVVNLETPVSTRDTPFPLYKRYVYRMAPEGLSALAWAGIDAVSLANNHIKDHGEAGIRATLDQLTRAKILPIGAGLDAKGARRGLVVTVRGVRVGLLASLEDSPMHSLYMQSFAWGPRPGCARLELGALRRDIARLRRRADLVIVMPHWGRSYTGVTALQRFYGRAFIDAGADAVIGAHPHVHHPIAVYRHKPIIYSLGNYVFGTPGRRWLRYGLVAHLVIDSAKHLRRVELTPLLIQNRLVHFRPEIVDGAEARRMLRKLREASLPYGARLRVVRGKAILDLDGAKN